MSIKLSEISGEDNSSFMEFKISSEFLGGIIIPASFTTSGKAPPELETKGIPHAIASIAANPNPS